MDSEPIQKCTLCCSLPQGSGFRVQGPGSGRGKGSKGRNKLDCIRGKGVTAARREHHLRMHAALLITTHERVDYLGFGAQSLGFRVQGSGFRVQGARCRMQDAGCRMQDAGCKEQRPVTGELNPVEQRSARTQGRAGRSGGEPRMRTGAPQSNTPGARIHKPARAQWGRRSGAKGGCRPSPFVF